MTYVKSFTTQAKEDKFNAATWHRGLLTRTRFRTYQLDRDLRLTKLTRLRPKATEYKPDAILLRRGCVNSEAT